MFKELIKNNVKESSYNVLNNKIDKNLIRELSMTSCKPKWSRQPNADSVYFFVSLSSI